MPFHGRRRRGSSIKVVGNIDHNDIGIALGVGLLIAAFLIPIIDSIWGKR